MLFVFRWLLNGLYLLLLVAIAPLLIFRRITQGKYRRGWREKLTGRLVRQHPERTCLWFHAVSVGEVLQLQKVLDDTAVRFPDAELFLTVTTETGYDVAIKKYPHYTVSFFPLDLSWAIDHALAAIHPAVIVLVELELWPNLILTAHRRQIPLVLINGRMGEKSFRGYSRLRPLMRRLLACFKVLAVQSETYAQRLTALGAPAERVIVTGNIKFDRVEADRNNPKTTEIRRSFQLEDSDQIFIAGSTQDPEESYALDAWLALRNDFLQLRLVIVPRHQERFHEVAAMIRQRGCEIIRRSEVAAGTSKLVSENQDLRAPPVVALLDTLGELAACWGMADIAFVGGSLTNRGGQNMIEPAGYGAAVLFGPNTWNFRDVTEALLSQEGARVVTGPEALMETLQELLQHPAEARRLGNVARAFVATQQGATQRTVDLIAGAIPHHPPNTGAPGPVTKSGNPFTRFWPLLKWGLFAIVFLFVGQRALQLWKMAPPESIQIHSIWLLAASLAYLVGWLPSVWFWRSLLIHLQQPLGWKNAIRAYYVGHLGKYIPGKGLVLVIRGSLVKESGVSRLLAGVTAAYETLVFMAAGTALCLAFSPTLFLIPLQNGLPERWTKLLETPYLVPITVLTLLFATTPLSAWLFSQIGRKLTPAGGSDTGKIPTISAGLISRGLLVTAFGWICHALSLGCVMQSISDTPFELTAFPLWLGACTLSTVGGFVVLLAPGGLGVREGLLIEALRSQPEISPSSAVIVAGLLRVVWFVSELVAAALLFLWKPKP